MNRKVIYWIYISLFTYFFLFGCSMLVALSFWVSLTKSMNFISSIAINWQSGSALKTILLESCLNKAFFQQYTFCKTLIFIYLSDYVKSKLSIYRMNIWNGCFSRVLGICKLLPHLCPCMASSPLLRPFKWGTVWSFSSRGIKIIKS